MSNRNNNQKPEGKRERSSPGGLTENKSNRISETGDLRPQKPNKDSPAPDKKK